MPDPSNDFSAEVRLNLIVGEAIYPLAQVGPERLVLEQAIALPPSPAEVVVSIDGHEERSSVRLYEGATLESPIVPYRIAGPDRGAGQ